MGSQWVNKQSLDFAFHSEKLFEPKLPSLGSKNMVKVLPLRFRQSLSPFTMLLNEGSSTTGLFRHLSNHVFRSPSVQKYIGFEGHLLLKKVQN